MHGTKACIAPGAFVFQSTRAVPARSLRTLPRLPHTPLRASIPNQGFIQDPLHTSAARPLAPPHPEAFGSGGPLGPTASSTDDDQPLPEVFGHRFRFEDAYWYINAAYWTTLLVSVLTGNKWLDGLSHFRNFVSAMALASAIFAGYFVIRWLADVRRHMVSKERHRDFQGALRYGWRALFWLAFVLWYTTGPVEAVLEWSGTPGAIMCTYGLVLAASSALLVGSVRKIVLNLQATWKLPFIQNCVAFV